VGTSSTCGQNISMNGGKNWGGGTSDGASGSKIRLEPEVPVSAEVPQKRRCSHFWGEERENYGMKNQNKDKHRTSREKGAGGKTACHW